MSSILRERRSTVHANGIRLSAVDFGGHGPNVLLLHGLAGRATEWRTTAAWLVRNFHVVALDQRGHGESAKACADFSRDAYVADAVAAIDALGLAPAVLIGQSMGALNAYLTAARRPELVRALLIVESGIRNDPATADRVAAWLDAWPLPFADREAARAFFGGDTLAARTWSEVLAPAGDGLRPEFRRADMLASARDHERNADYAEAWASVECPTLLVLGERGSIAPSDVERMRRLRPRAEVTVVPDAGHDVHLDNPAGWRAAAELFLKRFAARAAEPEVKPLVAADWRALRDLRLQALRTEPGVFTSSYEREAPRCDADWMSLAAGDETRHVFGVFDGDRLVGISGVFTSADEPQTASFVMTYIDPAYRGRHLARRCFAARLAWVRARPQYARVRIWHRRSNHRIARIVRAFGFEERSSAPHAWADGAGEELVQCELDLRKR